MQLASRCLWHPASCSILASGFKPMASPDTFFSLKNASQEQFLTFDAQQARH